MNGYILLDGMRMRNIIIRNSNVEYRGGPVELEGVYFVNCKFQINPGHKGIGLATTLLASQRTLFQVS